MRETWIAFFLIKGAEITGVRLYFTSFRRRSREGRWWKVPSNCYPLPSDLSIAALSGSLRRKPAGFFGPLRVVKVCMTEIFFSAVAVRCGCLHHPNIFLMSGTKKIHFVPRRRRFGVYSLIWYFLFEINAFLMRLPCVCRLRGKPLLRPAAPLSRCSVFPFSCFLCYQHIMSLGQITCWIGVYHLPLSYWELLFMRSEQVALLTLLRLSFDFRFVVTICFHFLSNRRFLAGNEAIYILLDRIVEGCVWGACFSL